MLATRDGTIEDLHATMLWDTAYFHCLLGQDTAFCLVCSTAFTAKTPPLPRVSTAFVAKTLPLPCGHQIGCNRDRRFSWHRPPSCDGEVDDRGAPPRAGWTAGGAVPRAPQINMPGWVCMSWRNLTFEFRGAQEMAELRAAMAHLKGEQDLLQADLESAEDAAEVRQRERRCLSLRGRRHSATD